VDVEDELLGQVNYCIAAL